MVVEVNQISTETMIAALCEFQTNATVAAAVPNTKNNLTIQVNQGDHHVVNQPSGVSIVNCYKSLPPIDLLLASCRGTADPGAEMLQQIERNYYNGVVGSDFGVNNYDRQDEVRIKVSTDRVDNNSSNDSGISCCNNVSTVMTAASEIAIGEDGNGLTANVSHHSDLNNVSASVNDRDLQDRSSVVESKSVIQSGGGKEADGPVVEARPAKSDSKSVESDTTSAPRSKQYRSTEAQTDYNFFQEPQQQLQQSTRIDDANGRTEQTTTLPDDGTADALNSRAAVAPVPEQPAIGAVLSREQRRRERRERRQNRNNPTVATTTAVSSNTRHFHPNPRTSGSAGVAASQTQTPYELLPDLLNTCHMLPPPYSTLPLGASLQTTATSATATGTNTISPIAAASLTPPARITHLPAPHLALQRLASQAAGASAAAAAGGLHPHHHILLQGSPILQSIPVAPITTAAAAAVVADDPRYLFPLPVLRR